VTTINNKHVLVTGGASGLGRLLALRCAELGAAVTIWDLDAAGAEAVAAEAKAGGAGAIRDFACDVADREQCTRAPTRCARRPGRWTSSSTTPVSSVANRCSS